MPERKEHLIQTIIGCQFSVVKTDYNKKTNLKKNVVKTKNC